MENEQKTRLTPPEGKASIQPDAPGPKPETVDPLMAEAAEGALETAGADPLHEAAPEPREHPSPADAPADPPASTLDVQKVYAGVNGGEVPVGQSVIQDLSSSMKSLNGNIVLAQRAATQSPEAKIGAKAALENAVSTHTHQWAAAVSHFGQTIAGEIRDHLIRIHGLTEITKHTEAASALTPSPSQG